MSKDGGSAFPTTCFDRELFDILRPDAGTIPAREKSMVASRGMSLRDYFAAKAAPVFMVELRADLRARGATVDDAYRIVALASYEMADALLAARKEQP